MATKRRHDAIGVGELDRIRAAARYATERSTREQGVPLHVTDPTVLQQVATHHPRRSRRRNPRGALR